MLPQKFFLQFWLHFGSILEAEFGDFSCYLLASFFDRFLKASGSILGGILIHFLIVFGTIFGAKIGDFPCYLLASFFDRFLKASGGILGGILAHFGRSFWLLFQTLRKKAHPTNSL